MKLLFLSTFIILTSCKLDIKQGNDVVSNSFSVGGNCHLVELAQDAICVEYQYGSFTTAQMDSDCDNQEAFYSAININTHFASYNPTIACRSGGKVGSCKLLTKRIYYYDNEWTTAAAETDCISLGGKYTDL